MQIYILRSTTPFGVFIDLEIKKLQNKKKYFRAQLPTVHVPKVLPGQRTTKQARSIAEAPLCQELSPTDWTLIDLCFYDIDLPADRDLLQ